MKEILKKIEIESQKLENSPLCQWLRSDNTDGEDRFSFTPSMLFFVLGFKDILTCMRVENPKTAIDHEINTHCEEDLDHWKWYLRDLELLGFMPQSWGSNMSDMFKQIWGNESFEVRNLVYTIIHQAKKHDDPLVSLVMIEYLEAAFAVFIRHMLVPINQMGYFEQLDYFGKLHVDKEAGHSRGAWVDGHRSEPECAFEQHDLDDDTRKQAEAIIDDISKQMLSVFDYWYSTRNSFVRFVPQKTTKVTTKEVEELA